MIGNRLERMGFKTYREYLRSEHWRAFRRRYRRSSFSKACAVCGKGRVHLHHHTYERLGCELLTDVTPLCESHHELVHEWLKAVRKGVKATYEAIEGLKAGLVLPRKGARIRWRDDQPMVRGDWVTFIYHGLGYTGRIVSKRSESEIMVKVLMPGRKIFHVDPNSCRPATPEEIGEWS